MKTISEILKGSKTIAVVGLSSRPERASHAVARYMQEHGYRIVPVNPTYAGQQILGEQVHASVQEAAAALAPRGDRHRHRRLLPQVRGHPPLAQGAIEIGASCLWMQLGIENRAAADLAAAAGLDVVMNHCIKIEHEAMSR